MPTEKLVGQVFRYYEDTGMVFFIILDRLTVGQILRFRGPHDDYIKIVDEMQVADQEVQWAYPGDCVGIHVEQKLEEQDEVFMQL